MQAFLNSSTGRWLIGGTFAGLSLLVLIPYLLSGEPAAKTSDQVRATAASAPAPHASALPAQAPATSPAASGQRMAAIPILPTADNGLKAGEEASLMLDEDRDEAWALRSEAALRNALRTISYIGGNSLYLSVRCRTTTCEVNGFANPDPATGMMKPVWEALERDTAGGGLRAQGLERTAAIFDTGRSGDEFKIYYHRIAPPPGQ